MSDIDLQSGAAATEMKGPHVYNEPRVPGFPVTNDAAKNFIQDIHSDIQDGFGFVPLIGAGLSAPSGIPLVWEIEAYLRRCIGLALGISTPGITPWNPRTHQWPAFENRNDPISVGWDGLIREALHYGSYGADWDPNRRVFREALGAIGTDR